MTREFRLLFAAITWLIAGCAAPPPEPPDGSVMQACVPGETRGCACAGGRMGAQACNAAGSGYDACAGCESPVQCGDGRCDSTETCSSCARDCGACAARCGDGTCNGTETCSTCVIDCGRCMTTPRCGDGTCNGTETCSTCPDDCGVCPPRCGDGACNGAETCETCMSDCSDRCGTTCMSCSQDTDCPSGQFCGVRRCDGAKGCYANTTMGCDSIGGTRCPATSAYNPCLSDTECGPYAGCRRYGDGRLICSRRCSTNADCPAPPADSTTTAICDPSALRCYLRCSGPGVCPFGLSCFRYPDGTYGYCS
jgi:hypothetical protein